MRRCVEGPRRAAAARRAQICQSPVIVEWPRGAETAQWRAGPEAQVFLLATPEDRETAMRRLVAEAAQKFYTQGGALPELPQGPDRELVCYGDL